MKSFFVLQAMVSTPMLRQVDDNPLPWLPESAWQAVASLGELEEFTKFSSDLVEAGPRFREWFNHITPEIEKLPLDWCANCNR